MLPQTVTETQNILELIAREQPYLNPALRRVADFILEHPNQAKSIPIHELAQECRVAESSVTRFVKVIGLKSYQELKIAIAETLSARNIPETEVLCRRKIRI